MRQASGTGPMMQSTITRGAPYSSMLYKASTPRITVERPIVFNPVVDDDPTKVAPYLSPYLAPI